MSALTSNMGQLSFSLYFISHSVELNPLLLLLLPELTVHRSLCPSNQFLMLGLKQQRKVTHPRVAPLLRKEGPLPRPWVLACVRAPFSHSGMCLYVIKLLHRGGVVGGVNILYFQEVLSNFIFKVIILMD